MMVDFRKQLDGLVKIIVEALDKDPSSGDLFVFRNRSGTAVWELSHNEMQWLFSGINFMKQKVKKFDKIEYFY